MKDEKGKYFYLCSCNFSLSAHELSLSMVPFISPAMDLELDESVMYDVNVKFRSDPSIESSAKNVDQLNMNIYRFNGTILIKIFERGVPYFQLKIVTDSGFSRYGHDTLNSSRLYSIETHRSSQKNSINKRGQISALVFVELLEKNQIIKRLHDLCSQGLIKSIRMGHIHVLKEQYLTKIVEEELVIANIGRDGFGDSDILNIEVHSIIRKKITENTSLNLFLLKQNGYYLQTIDNPTLEEKKIAVVENPTILTSCRIRDIIFAANHMEEMLNFLYQNLDFIFDQLISAAGEDHRIQRFLIQKNPTLIFKSPIYGHNLYMNADVIERWRNWDHSCAAKAIRHDPYLVFLIKSAEDDLRLQRLAFNHSVFTTWKQLKSITSKDAYYMETVKAYELHKSLGIVGDKFRDKRTRHDVVTSMKAFNPHPQIIEKFEHIDLAVEMGLLDE